MRFSLALMTVFVLLLPPATLADDSSVTTPIGFAENVVATAVNEPPVARDDPGGYSSLLASYAPVGWWRLGESSGATAVDLGTAANDGTYTSAVLGEAGGTVGDLDTAIRLDDTGHVEIPHDPAYLIDEGAVQLWFRVASRSSSTDGLLSKDSMNFDTGGHLHVTLRADGRVEARIQSVSDEATITAPTGVSVDEWHHVLVSFGPAGFRLYVDGALAASDPWTMGLGTSTGGTGNFEPIALGASTHHSDDLLITPLVEPFTGWMDEVAIFAGPIGDADASALYLTGADRFEAVAGVPLLIPAERGVLRNDTDAEGSPLTTSLVSGPVNADSFSLAADGGFSYTANVGFSGIDSFVYEAIDDSLDTSQATATIEVVLPTYTISGVVFEDAVITAGVGEAFNGGEGDTGIAGARVELFGDFDVFQSFTTTDGSGNYSFAGVNGGAGYKIRVVAATLDAGVGALPEQTLESDGATDYGTFGEAMGGQDALAADTTAQSTLIGAEHWVAVSVGSADVTGVDFGFSYELVVNTNDDGQGSLRRFIDNANSINGVQISRFNIPTTDPNYTASPLAYLIQPESSLPDITDSTIIDGTTQPDFGATPVIVLDGIQAGIGASGLRISAGASTVRGLVIHRFTASGVYVTTSGGNTIEGNYIGTDVTGLLDRGNGAHGIHIDTDTGGNTIGGITAPKGNVISGNGINGIFLQASSTNKLWGNYIGADRNGAPTLGNDGHGVLIDGGDDNVIGGSTLGKSNLITGNRGSGVALSG